MGIATAIPKDHDAFVAYRASLKGLGASDAAAALGVSRFRSSFELWEELTGRRIREATTLRQRRGIFLEPVAAAWYTEATGIPLRMVRHTVTDPRFPHLFAHPDRSRKGGYVQVKTRWSDYPDGIVPVEVETQVTVEATLGRVAEVDVALMTFEQVYIHPVPVDPEVGGELCEWLDRWYVRHVDGDVPPRDGSRAYSRYLDRFVREREEQATEAQAALMAQLRTIRRQVEKLEAADETVLLALKESMPGVKRLVGEGFRINWIDVKGKTTTDWKAVAYEYRLTIANLAASIELDGHPVHLDLEAAVTAHTTTGDPGSQFRPTWTGPEEEASNGE